MKNFKAYISAYYRANNLYLPRALISLAIFIIFAALPFFGDSTPSPYLVLLSSIIGFSLSQSYLMYRQFNSTFRKLYNKNKERI